MGSFQTGNRKRQDHEKKGKVRQPNMEKPKLVSFLFSVTAPICFFNIRSKQLLAPA